MQIVSLVARIGPIEKIEVLVVGIAKHDSLFFLPERAMPARWIGGVVNTFDVVVVACEQLIGAGTAFACRIRYGAGIWTSAPRING
jgi:hypothetical protein